MDLDDIERRSIRGLAPEIEDHRRSGFRAVLKRIEAPHRVLEVGTTGGDHTTKHLLDVFPGATIDIAEILEERADHAAAKFAADPSSRRRVRIHNVDAMDFRSRARFDLIVIDLPFTLIDVGYEKMLPRLSRLLSRRGGIFLYTIYDAATAFGVSYDGENLLEGREAHEAFMTRYFGATQLTLEIVRERMRREGFAALALVDRWMLHGRPGHGLVYLERLETRSF